MANEVTSSVSIAYDDGFQNGSLGVVSRLLTSAGQRFTKLIQNVGTSEEAVNLGELSAVGAYILVNLDPDNFVTVRCSSGGVVRDKLKPDALEDGTGGWCAGDCMGGGSQAPTVQADTASCRVAILVVEA